MMKVISTCLDMIVQRVSHAEKLNLTSFLLIVFFGDMGVHTTEHSNC